MDELQKILDRIGEVEAKATKIAEQLESTGDTAEQEQLKTDLKAVKDELAPLIAEREKAVAAAERDSLKAEVKTLKESFDDLRAPAGFSLGVPTGDADKAVYGAKSERSFYADAKAAFSGNSRAMERIEEALGQKAMTEGTGSAGGYLVPDEISSELLELRQANAVLRPLFSKVQVESDTLRIASVTSGLTAGWVAELAEKPVSDLAFAEISTSVFTAAGLAVVSNQLLADSTPSVDGLVNADLARRLANLEEVAFINGSGTGQPRGILNTSGVNAIPLTSTVEADLLDAIIDAITAIYTNYYGGPNAIVMHPRTWARLVKAKTDDGAYLLGGPDVQGRTATQGLPGYGSGPVPFGTLFGLPVYCTPNVPTNLGAGTDESRVIVGNFDEGLILDRQGITLDSSGHVYFTSNQTIFRAEERVGFTAARYPKAFSVIGGVGLVDG